PAPDILISRKGYAFSHTTPTTRTTAEELEVNCAQILSTNCCHGTSAPRYSTNNASGVAASALSTPNAARAGSALANVQAIIDSGGQIMVGTIAPVKGAAVAHDGEKTVSYHVILSRFKAV